MRLIDRLSGRQARERMSLDEYGQMLNMYINAGLGYQTPSLNQTLAGTGTERPADNFQGLATQAYASNGVVFACMLVRQLVFSSVRFQFQQFLNGKPSSTFGDTTLGLLERPWPGGTTQDLLSRMIQDADLAGNSYWVRQGDELVRLRPDWVQIVGKPRRMPKASGGRSNGQVGWTKTGYLYTEGGIASQNEGVAFTVDEVAHFAPIPDPLAVFTGMSWLTPILREIQADQSMTRHQRKFFDRGAPQPLDAKIMTPTGWSTMGEMRVGSRVIGSDGKAHDVVAVHPQGERDIYRVHFSNGASVECTKDHLWSVANAHDRRCGVTRTMTLEKIISGGITYPSGPAKWSVPLVAPIEFDAGESLTVDPYLLGSLLGDGCMRANAQGSSGTVKMASHRDDADEQERLLAPLLPDGVRLRRQEESGNYVSLYFPRVKSGPYRNPLAEALRGLGVFNKLGYEKAIPQAYMTASVNDRVAVLQGLLDTDGSIDRKRPSEVMFTSTSEQLAQQVADLACGLGGIGRVRASRPDRPGGRAQWTVRITRLPEWIIPFRLARKADLYRPTLRGGAYRYIQRVEFIGRKQAQCISVDSDDHLYVTDDFVLTHNTVNMIIKHPIGADAAAVQKWSDEVASKHGGTENAWKNLNLYPGADATVVGSNLKDIDFKNVRGGGETRIAAAAGVPPVIVGLSEGLAAATYSNYGQARRRLADGTAHPLWQNIAGSLERVVPPPSSSSRLWYDATDVPFLREDEADAANIAAVRASTVNTYVAAGFTPESAVQAVDAGDINLLVHTGLTSVQLLPPGTPTKAVGSQTNDAPPLTLVRRNDDGSTELEDTTTG